MMFIILSLSQSQMILKYQMKREYLLCSIKETSQGPCSLKLFAFAVETGLIFFSLMQSKASFHGGGGGGGDLLNNIFT